MARSTFIYVTYIRTTPEKLWSALTTDVEFMKQYWFGMHCESQWTAGSSWEMVRADGSICDAGEIVESVPVRRLVIRWRHQDRAELKAEGDSLWQQWNWNPMQAKRSKLTITHGIEREPSKLIAAVSGGWPMILSNPQIPAGVRCRLLCRNWTRRPSSSKCRHGNHTTWKTGNWKLETGDWHEVDSKVSRGIDGAYACRQHRSAIGSVAHGGHDHRPRSRRTHRWFELAGRL